MKTLIVPCSGIGKVHGLIGREAVYQALEELGPDVADTLCLARLVTSDQEALTAIRRHPCVTVDGCAKLCAYKNVEIAGGKIVHSVRVIDAFKDHKGSQPGTATSLTPDGWTIAGEIARNLVVALRPDLKTAEEVQHA